MKIWMEKHAKQIEYGVLAFLFLGFAVTRLWQLTTLPQGIHVDEAGMAYDAWCLANWGTDRYLNSWPVYLINFSTGQSALYAYLCAGLFKLFGYSMWMVRLPAVLFSFLTLVFGMKLMRLIHRESVYPALLLGAFVVFCPYFIMSSRFGLDCNLMLGASTVFLYFFMTAVETGKSWRYFVSGLTGGILLYSYVLTYMVLPIFLVLVLIYVIWVKKFYLKNWVIMAVPMGVLAFPLILVQIVNYFDLEQMQLGIFTIVKMSGYRLGEIGSFSWENFVCAVKSIFVGDEYLFDSIPGIWNLYAVTAVMFVIGFPAAVIKAVKWGRKRQLCGLVFPLLWFVVILVFQSHMKSNTYRINGIFLVTALLAVEGIVQLLSWFARHSEKLAAVAMTGVCIVYAACFARFGIFYYSGKYTDATYMKITYFGIQMEEGIAFLENDSVLSQKLTYVSEKGIFYAVSAWPTPHEFDIIADGHGIWNQYWFGALCEIDDSCNYIVRDGYDEYCEELRRKGFEENRYDCYSVFYKRQ